MTGRLPAFTRDQRQPPTDRPDIRAEYVAQGLEVCAGSSDCHRAPFRRGLCRPHLAIIPGNSPLGPCAIVPIKLPLSLWRLIRKRAALEGLKGSTWMRRLVAKELGVSLDRRPHTEDTVVDVPGPTTSD